MKEFDIQALLRTAANHTATDSSLTESKIKASIAQWKSDPREQRRIADLVRLHDLEEAFYEEAVAARDRGDHATADALFARCASFGIDGTDLAERVPQPVGESVGPSEATTDPPPVPEPASAELKPAAFVFGSDPMRLIDFSPGQADNGGITPVQVKIVTMNGTGGEGRLKPLQIVGEAANCHLVFVEGESDARLLRALLDRAQQFTVKDWLTGPKRGLLKHHLMGQYRRGCTSLDEAAKMLTDLACDDWSVADRDGRSAWLQCLAATSLLSHGVDWHKSYALFEFCVDASRDSRRWGPKRVAEDVLLPYDLRQLSTADSVEEVVDYMVSTDTPALPVYDRNMPVGVVTMAGAVAAIRAGAEPAALRDVMSKPGFVRIDTSLDDVRDHLLKGQAGLLFVLDTSGTVAGYITPQTALAGQTDRREDRSGLITDISPGLLLAHS